MFNIFFKSLFFVSVKLILILEFLLFLQKLKQKNQQLKQIMDQLRNLIWEINSMLAVRSWARPQAPPIPPSHTHKRRRFQTRRSASVTRTPHEDAGGAAEFMFPNEGRRSWTPRQGEEDTAASMLYISVSVKNT